VDPALADVQLNVVLDQDRSLDPGDVVSVEAGPRRRWRVQLPAELYEGHAHHIGLQIKSNGRLLESAAFLFTGAPQILQPPARAHRGEDDVGSALAEQKEPAISGDSAARNAANTGPPRDAGRGRLAGFLKEEFSADTAKRVLGYFDIIDALEAEIDPASRQDHLASLARRMQRMSEAADDGRPIEASIIIPVFNSVAFTIACAISVFEHAPSTRYEITRRR
jgi:hypothetical protein